MRLSKARKKALIYKQNGCEICGSKKDLEGHHIYKYAVFLEREGFDKIVWLCKKCHKELEDIIRKRENDVLRNKPELYLNSWTSFKKIKSQ